MDKQPTNDHSQEENAKEATPAEEGKEESSSEELSKLQDEVQSYKDKYLRSLAESENARKRLQKENEDLTAYAVKDLVLEFLQPIDYFKNALKYAGDATDEIKNWAKGFEMILTQLEQVLESRGITAYCSLGKTFDPNLHEAVEMIETEDQKPGTILKQYVEGYRLEKGGKTTILRPARVQVAKAKEDAKPQEPKASEASEASENAAS
ncbi:MAG: grpE [Chlamydiales bacterium]|jgi:molecular chaperone GrpE|nr:grpE [Chlamydiales bacterium]